MNKIAIIIPAYKSIFLRQTLECFVNQTNQNFNLYIGDDNSPENIKDIIDEFQDKLNIKYHKFTNNIGSKYLVKQWSRCIDLVEDEEWIWLFSDDDLLDYNCVEVFYNTIKFDKKKYDVYRFNTRVIKDDNSIISDNESPFEESAFDMCIEILKFRRGHSMPDHIFNKSKFIELGGFVYTNYAQAADWATSIKFATEKGICSMREAKVSWRIGNYNISGNAYKNNHQKVLGHIQFIKWLLHHFKDKISSNDYKILKTNVYNNLILVIKYHYKMITLKTGFSVWRELYRISGNFFNSFRDTLQLIYLKK